MLKQETSQNDDLTRSYNILQGCGPQILLEFQVKNHVRLALASSNKNHIESYKQIFVRFLKIKKPESYKM